MLHFYLFNRLFIAYWWIHWISKFLYSCGSQMINDKKYIEKFQFDKLFIEKGENSYYVNEFFGKDISMLSTCLSNYN